MRSRPLPKKLRLRLLDEGLRIAAEQGITGLMGENVRVLVRIDGATRKVHYSFRALDDLSQDDPADRWVRLR